MRRAAFVLLLALTGACHEPQKQPTPPAQAAAPATPASPAVAPPPPEPAAARSPLIGDFDGDGTLDTLTLHVLARPGYREMVLPTEIDDADSLTAYIVRQNPVVIVTGLGFDTLRLGEGQIRGAAWLSNEGDLNGDGTDELAYVPDNADFSNLNACHIVNARTGHWRELASFNIHEEQLLGMTEAEADRRANALITPVRPGLIRAWFYDFTGESEDTTKLIQLPR